MTSTFRALAAAAPLAALALLLHACPREPCTGADCDGPDSGDTTDGCVRVNGSCGAALTCCATDTSGNDLTCDADAGRCLTTCGQRLAACGPGAPCCAGTSGGYALECAQGACAQCLGAGAPCGQDDTPCCAGATCRSTGYNYDYTCQ